MIATRLFGAAVVAAVMATCLPASANPRHHYAHREMVIRRAPFWQHPYDMLGQPVVWRVRYYALQPMDDEN